MSGLIVICGPTATGKSARALQLAQRLRVPLLSADSRQIYRQFDIGTAKPTPAERARWPHHAIDLAEPTETFTVVQYQQQAQHLIQTAHAAGQTPIVVGGTGLYVQAVTEGLAIPAVAPNSQLRSQLSQLPQPLLHQYLQQVDSVGASKIHPHDCVRTLRSLEVFYSTGRPPSTLQRRQPPAYSSLILGLCCRDTAVLEQRIARRTDRMLAVGWLEEVQHLQQQYGRDLPLLQTLGYRELGQYLAGHWSLERARLEIVKHTRQFAKRQMTWFRRTPNLIWLDCDAPDIDAQVYTLVRQYLARLEVPITSAETPK
ncbi:tRNA (adenosine(37)-N6)-dimethylallyltransferase MiaA [Synechococcus sp. PCC 7336]|uniref:tRNA (adenosine(37)-N6)-dimethylallyltransferase MiaA n=1 Tax=Synechococcus sp. PCC 7336 TaxID=195250 RepID=UPI00034630FC|nr:tRNA (adenosine(37)-N6)-dimethylallyltransferase MiaA [Synechococcus sp. PCC 7336]